MSKALLYQLGIFVLVLIGLNFFLDLHISIIGSVVLTLVLSVAFNAMQNR
jgi:hypothetical protein